MDARIEATINRMEATSGNDGKHWSVPRSTAEFLNFLVRANNTKCALEIGTSIGYSGIFLAEALSHTNGILYTVESHQGRFDRARANFAEAGVESSIRQIAGHAPEVLEMIPEMIDFVFIDATKMEYIKYFSALKGRLKKGALIVADNVSTHTADMEDFIGAIRADQSLFSVFVPIDNGLMLIHV